METIGAVVSLIVILKLPDAILPRVSVAEHATVVVPSGKVEPEAGVQVTGREPSTMSVAVAVKVTTLPEELVASSVMLDGSVRTGAVVSRTVIVKLAVPVLPDESVAEHATVVVPSGKVEPEAGVQTGVKAPSLLSVAVAVKVTSLPEELVASSVIEEGTVTTGAVVSATVFDTVTEIW
jgi:hypothetical protein